MRRRQDDEAAGRGQVEQQGKRLIQQRDRLFHAFERLALGQAFERGAELASIPWQRPVGAAAHVRRRQELSTGVDLDRVDPSGRELGRSRELAERFDVVPVELGPNRTPSC